MNESFKKYAAEMIGTFALTFIGGAAIINGQTGLMGVAMAHGLVLAVMISSVGHISGAHFNPAVTIGFLATGRISGRDSIPYILSQFLGATLAAYLLKVLIPDAMQADLGGQAVAEGVSFGVAVVVEIILTFLLVVTIFATAIDQQGAFKIIAGFAIGMVVAADILAAGPVTGASMNPARSFGPAFVAGVWVDHLVYRIGPIIGSLLGSQLYTRFFLTK